MALTVQQKVAGPVQVSWFHQKVMIYLCSWPQFPCLEIKDLKEIFYLSIFCDYVRNICTDFWTFGEKTQLLTFWHISFKKEEKRNTGKRKREIHIHTSEQRDKTRSIEKNQTIGKYLLVFYENKTRYKWSLRKYKLHELT